MKMTKQCLSCKMALLCITDTLGVTHTSEKDSSIPGVFKMWAYFQNAPHPKDRHLLGRHLLGRHLIGTYGKDATCPAVKEKVARVREAYAWQQRMVD